MNQEALENMRTRRSIRAYQPQQIKAEELDAVLEAGTWAPTGMGRQSPRIVVVQDKATRDELSRLNARALGSQEGDPFYGAPTVLVVFADTARPTYREDGTLVMANLMLAAHAVGLGSCWIHRAKPVFASPEGRALMQKWGLGENYEGIGHCILGYAAQQPKPAPRKTDYIIRT